MNVLPDEKRLLILRCLLEGNSIRSTSRIVGVSKTTVLRLLSNIGQYCDDFHQCVMKNISCENVQVDELWSFVNSKKRSDDKDVGNCWTWVAICSDSKVVPCWYVGDRSSNSANIFIKRLSESVNGEVQISSDGLNAYKLAIKKYMPNATFGMMVKHYVKNKAGGKLTIYKNSIQGSPTPESISTSFIERHNLNMRMSMRRYTRKTNAFSKTIKNHLHALSLYFFYYNFIRKHSSLKTTPANAIGLMSELDLDFLLKRLK